MTGLTPVQQENLAYAMKNLERRRLNHTIACTNTKFARTYVDENLGLDSALAFQARNFLRDGIGLVDLGGWLMDNGQMQEAIELMRYLRGFEELKEEAQAELDYLKEEYGIQ